MRYLLLSLAIPALLSPQLSTGEIGGSVIGAGAGMLHIAKIELRNGTIRRTAETAGGRFHFTQLPPGVYDLTITRDFYRSTIIRAVHIEPGQIRVLPPVGLVFEGFYVCDDRSPAHLRPLDESDATKGTLAGRITDDRGRPLADANVRVYIPNAGILGSTATDSSGRFFIPGIPARSGYRIEVAHDQFFTADFSDFQVQPGYESFYDNIDLAPCEKDRCQPALQPIRPLPACA